MKLRRVAWYLTWYLPKLVTLHLNPQLDEYFDVVLHEPYPRSQADLLSLAWLMLSHRRVLRSLDLFARTMQRVRLPSHL
jgi:hypothetical protein